MSIKQLFTKLYKKEVAIALLCAGCVSSSIVCSYAPPKIVAPVTSSYAPPKIIAPVTSYAPPKIVAPVIK